MKLLDAPASSVHDLATDVLNTIDQLRESRTDWFIIVIDPGVGPHLHGPYVTKNAAYKEIEKNDVYAASKGATGLVMQLIKSVDEGVLF